MARPRQVSDADIVAAARVCFLEHGPSVSTTVIAGTVGLSQAALFKRFGTKDELMFAALMPPEVPEWIEHVSNHGPDERPIPEQLLDIAQRVSSSFTEMTPCLMTLKASGADMKRLMERYDVPPPARGLQVISSWFKSAADAGRIQSAHPYALALMFIGALHGRVMLSHILGQEFLSEEDYLDEMVGTLWRGLCPPVEEG